MKSQAIYFELIWLVIASLAVLAALAPPWLQQGPFMYAAQIAINIFALVTLARLVFLSHHSAWLRPKVVKAIVSISCIPIALHAILTLNLVQTLVDAEGLDALFFNQQGNAAISWGTYLRNLTIFSCAGTVISALLLPIVLMVRVWQQVKMAQRQEKAKYKHTAPTQPKRSLNR